MHHATPMQQICMVMHSYTYCTVSVAHHHVVMAPVFYAYALRIFYPYTTLIRMK